MANISIKKDFEDGQKLFAQQLNNNFETIELGINAGNKLIWKDDNGAEFQTFRGTTEEIENRPIIDGQELYNIENGDTFLDVGETRKVMNKPLWKDDNGAQIQSFRGTTAEVAARPIIDGQTLYNIETGETALDVGNKRISTGAGNVVYIGDEEPQNDATKIWIENDQVLNLGSEVAISSEEPTTQEKVWIQKGKNLFNPNTDIEEKNKYRGYATGNLTSANGYMSLKIEVEPNTSYVFSSSIGVSNLCYFDENMNYISGSAAVNTINTPSNCKYITIASDMNNNQIQLEKGEVATTYEPYITKKIHTKTDNGYEEFYNEEEHNKVNYSTSEQRIGAWIDGKPLYRRVFEVPETSISSSNTTVINFNLDGNVDVKRMNAFIKTQTSNYGFNLAYNGIYDGFRMRLFGNTVQILAAEDVAAEEKITSGNVIVEYTKTTD